MQFQSLLQQQLRAVKWFKDVDKIEAVKCHRQQKAMQYIPSELFSLGRSPGRATALQCAICDAETTAIRRFKMHCLLNNGIFAGLARRGRVGAGQVLSMAEGKKVMIVPKVK